MTNRNLRQIIADDRRVLQRNRKRCEKEARKQSVFDSVQESAVILRVFGEPEDKEAVDVDLLFL